MPEKLNLERHSKRQPPTPEQIRAQQQADAERDTARKTALPARAVPAAVAVPDNRSAIEQFQIEDGSTMMPRPIRFNGKEGYAYFAEDKSHVDEKTIWIALVDQMTIAKVRFNGENQRPDIIMGCPYAGFRRPARETLGDNNPAEWPIGLSGQREDPWQDQSNLIVQHAETGELATFSTFSKTGRNAVAKLAQHYDRLQKTHPDQYPLIRITSGGFQGKYGWTHIPVFVVVGMHPKAETAKPETPQSDLNDEIPF